MTLSVVLTDSVVKLKVKMIFAGLTPTACAICSCAPVIRQMPLSVVLVIAAHVGCAALMFA